MGITQSVNLVKEAFGAMFDDTVGREIRLREQILQTSITLASTNRVLLKGVDIEDPTAKLKALEKPIEASIDRLRTKSLEIAGTTSEALISTFSIVSSQIGRFGGTLKDAEDLAAKFAGALGTLGMSDPGYARQEIGSLLMGNIGPDSVLAKTLGITNADIEQAKRSAGGLVQFLKDKLATFEAGQKTASRGFSGLTSNFAELSQEIKRNFGAPILDGILTRLSKLYDMIGGAKGSGAFEKYLKTARAAGSLVAGIGNDALATITSSQAGQSINTKSFTAVADTLEKTFAKVSRYITEQFDKAGAAIRTVVDSIASAVKTLLPTFAEVVAVLAKLKIDQLQVQLSSFSQLVRVISSLAGAYKEYLNMLNAFMSTPLGQYINEIRAEFKVLESTGVMAIARLVASLVLARASFATFKAGLIAVAEAIKVGLVNAINTLGTVFEFVAKVVVTTITTVVNVVTAAISKLMRLGVAVFTELQTVLAAVSTQFAAMGGVFQTLSQPLMKMSVALGALNAALDKTDANMMDFAAKTRAAMGVADTSIQKTKANILNLGEILGTKLVNGAKAAGSAMLNLGAVFLRSIATMALWQVAFAVVFDGIRRLGEAWERMNQDRAGNTAINELNNGLAEQARQARATGKALDEVTAARVRMRQEETNTTIKNNQKDIEDSLRKEAEQREKIAAFTKQLQREEKSLRENGYRSQFNVREADTGIKLAREEIAKEKKKQAEAAANIQRARAALGGTGSSDSGDGVNLAAQRNRQVIEDLANFEKSTRLAIEDEIYNYRRQIQQKELELFRTKGEVEIAQIDFRNRRLIEGTTSDAQASLSALNTWITTKKRSELDLEARKREAAQAMAEMERALGRFRLNLENQIAELRKRINEYDIKVLDRRIKGEQLIAEIRNGSISWEAPGSGDGRAFVGQTGHASGPHAHLQGSNQSKVIEEALHAIKQWQRDGVQHIQLSNAKIDVKGITDDTRLREAIRAEITAHSARSRAGVFTADIAVPLGTRVPVPLGPLTPNRGNGGITGVNPNTGISWMHLKEGSQGGGSAPPSAGGGTLPGGGSGLSTFERGYLTRMSHLEGGYGVHGSAARSSSNARGYFQLIPSSERWLRDAGKGDLADRLLSTDYNVAIKAAKEFAIFSRPASRALFAQGDVAGLDRLLNRTWTSLPGGDEAATGARLARGNSYLRSGGIGGGDLGAAPTPPDVNLKIDTGELDGALSRLKNISAELLRQSAAIADIQNKDNWNAYVRSLDTTTKALEEADTQLRNQKISADVVIAAMQDNPFSDSDELQVQIQHKQALAALDIRRSTLLAQNKKMEGMTAAERQAAEKAIEDAYKKDVAQLDLISKKDLERLGIAKQIAQFQSIISSTTQARTSAINEIIQMRSAAAGATLSPTDFLGKRMLAAREAITNDYNERTQGGTQPLLGKAAEQYEAFARQQVALAQSLAAVDKELYVFAERLRTAQESAQILTEGYKGLIKSVMQGNSLADASKEMATAIADRFTDMLLNYAFKPIEAQIEEMFKKLFNVNDPQSKNTTALDSLTFTIDGKLVPALDKLTTAISGTPEGGTTSGAGPGATPKQEVNRFTETLQKATQGLALTATVTMSIVGGIQQMKKGGAFNTLMGLASIFGGLGAGFGAFAPGGLFARRAAGGPISAARPYLVGEQGRELILPAKDGVVLPNHVTEAFLASRNALGGYRAAPEDGDPLNASRAALESTALFTRERQNEQTWLNSLAIQAAPMNVKYEAQVINNVEYVTADQFRRGMTDAAERGRHLTITALKNNISSRRQIGI